MSNILETSYGIFTRASELVSDEVDAHLHAMARSEGNPDTPGILENRLKLALGLKEWERTSDGERLVFYLLEVVSVLRDLGDQVEDYSTWETDFWANELGSVDDPRLSFFRQLQRIVERELPHWQKVATTLNYLGEMMLENPEKVNPKNEPFMSASFFELMEMFNRASLDELYEMDLDQWITDREEM